MSKAGNTKFSMDHALHKASHDHSENPPPHFAASILRVYERLFELPTFILTEVGTEMLPESFYLSQPIECHRNQLAELLQELIETPPSKEEVLIVPLKQKKPHTYSSAQKDPASIQFAAIMPLIRNKQIIAIVGALCQADVIENNGPYSWPSNSMSESGTTLMDPPINLPQKLKNFKGLAKILAPGLLRILSHKETAQSQPILEGREPQLNAHKTGKAKEVFTVCNIDPLTGLRNRDSFERSITNAIESINHPDQRVGLFYVDLDHLKVINDAHGHAAGDAALVAISDRLKQLETDTISAVRIGGDEFALLVEGATCSQIRALLEELPAALSCPVYFDHCEIRPKVSIGAAVYPRHATNVKELLESADTALYHAKKRGRNRVSLFSKAMRTRLERQMALQHTAKQAFLQKRVGTKFRPILSQEGKHLTLLEAVPDWPPQILEIARGNDLQRIFDNASFSNILGDTAIAAIINTMKTCQRTPMSECSFIFRIPIPSLLKEGFCDDLIYLLQDSDVDPKKFVLEIPSQVLLRANARILITQLNALTKRGIKICVNHFESSGLKIEHFQKLNITYIKVHAGSVEKLFEDTKTARLLTAAAEFAHALNIKIILSEIKTEKAEAIMQELKVELVQGDYHAPMQRFSDIYREHVLSLSPETNITQSAHIPSNPVKQDLPVLPHSMINYHY
ncbi:diguanylate cyclase [Pseudovibrio sp. Tun.PSC04-5.I4]|uniref:bifunctional diguanylate cyclase/phosphodiesterase n=1 Tax=Pseudovibrio sp. Tun.PSC04-5.I4 TaxID=1798213 RepID=UPI001AD8FDA5|nr:diguanylate cyclase [Pseudovibrio sp. Tun.PSC04-5.I4]